MQDDDIDKEMLDEEPKKKIVRRAKPAVEGINVPKTTRSNVVVKTAKNDEREERILPERATKKRGSMGKALAIFVFILILIAAAYEVYSWNKNRSAQSTTPDTQAQAQTQTQTSTDTNTATSSLDMIPAATSTPAMASSTPTTTPVTTTATQLTINQTPTGYLNVRSTPSSAGKLLTQVHPGETYTYIATKNGWYQIMLTDGTSGWVIGQYVTVVK